MAWLRIFQLHYSVKAACIQYKLHCEYGSFHSLAITVHARCCSSLSVTRGTYW
jgi:hypothetical protein